MALSGSLLDFGFTDILQLVKMQRKAGRLALTSREQQVVLWFDQGDLVHAEDEARPLTQALGARLAADGTVAPAQWRKAVEGRKGNGAPLAEALPAGTGETLAALADAYRRETAFGVFRWLEGDYTFEADEPPPPAAGAVPLPPINTDDLLMDAASRAAAWQEVDANLANTRLILAPAGSDPGPDGEAGDASLSETQGHVLALLDRRRDVRAVVEASRWGCLETCQALAALLAAKRVRVVGESPPRPGREVEGAPRKTRARRRVRRRRRSLWQAAVVALGCAGLMALTGWMGLRSFSGEYPSGLAGFFQSTASYRDHQVRQALRVYYLTHGAYPETLDALRDAGLVGEGVVTPAMRYRRTRDGFILSRG
jgi:hypothetical protein